MRLQTGLILIIHLIFQNTSTAQTNTVESLVTDVLSNSPELREAEAEVRKALGERRSAGQWKNPEVSAEYGEKRNSDRSTGDLTGKGGAQRYGFSQTFEFPGKAGVRKAIADHNIHLAELSLEQLRLEVAARTRSLAIEWLAADREVRVAREVEERHESLVAVLKKRSPAGAQSVLDRRVIEADRVSILARSHEAEERRDAARIALLSLRGKSVEAPFHLESSLDLPPMTTPWADLFQRAVRSSLALQSRGVELQRAGAQKNGARLATAPDFTVGPFFSQENSGDKERILGVGISLPLPIWNQNQGEIESADAGGDQADAAMTVALRNFERELARNWNAYHHVTEILEKCPLSLMDELGDAADLADRQYRLGAISVHTYEEMQDKYLDASGALLRTLQEGHEHRLAIQLLASDPALLGRPGKEGPR